MGARSASATAAADSGAVRQLAHTAMARTDVGGLPVTPRPPFLCKAPFSPAFVIEEYTRPARLVRGGRPVTLPALSEPEIVEITGVGLLEAFNTDGLRSLVDTVRADAMVERTLRYPGHLAAMRVIAVPASSAPNRSRCAARPSCRARSPAPCCSPRAVRTRRTRSHGAGGGCRRRDTRRTARSLAWRMVDRPEAGSPLSSMARTTGCPAAIVARWLHAGAMAAAGVHPPERLGLDGHADAMLAALAARGLHVSRT